MTWRQRLGLGVLVSASVFTLLPVAAISPLLSTIATHFGAGGLGALKAQSIITLSGIGMMVGGPFAGWLGDRIGARWLLLIMLALNGLAGSAGLYLTDLTALLASRVLLGVSAVGIASASYLMIASRFQGAARARMLGYQIAVIAIAGVACLLASGALAAAISWRAPFGIYLVAFVALALAVVSVFPEPPPRQAEGPKAGSGKALLRMWPVFLMIVPLYLAAHMFVLQLSFVLAGDGIASPVTQSRIMTALMAMTFVSGVTYGRIFEKAGPRWTFALILLLMGLADVVLGLTHGAGAAVAACVLSGFAGAAAPPYVINLVLSRAEPHVQGRALGLMYMAMYLGDFINPLVINPIRAALGNHMAFTIVGLVLVAAAVLRAVLPSKAPAAVTTETA